MAHRIQGVAWLCSNNVYGMGRGGRGSQNAYGDGGKHYRERCEFASHLIPANENCHQVQHDRTEGQGALGLPIGPRPQGGLIVSVSTVEGGKM